MSRHETKEFGGILGTPTSDDPFKPSSSEHYMALSKSGSSGKRSCTTNNALSATRRQSPWNTSSLSAHEDTPAQSGQPHGLSGQPASVSGQLSTWARSSGAAPFPCQSPITMTTPTLAPPAFSAYCYLRVPISSGCSAVSALYRERITLPMLQSTAGLIRLTTA